MNRVGFCQRQARQIRAIRKLAVKLKVTTEEAAVIWVREGCAEQWANCPCNRENEYGKEEFTKTSGGV